jgi:hypothetical protein
MCHECRRAHKSKNYCIACWPKKPKARFRSPTLAFLLSVAPGLGHLYAGSYLKMLLFPAAFIPCAVNYHAVPALIPVFIFLFGAWDARMSALKKNGRITAKLAGRPDPGGHGAGEGDWLIWGGAVLLSFLFLWLPAGAGVALEPMVVWLAFAVVFALSLVMGNGAPERSQSHVS